MGVAQKGVPVARWPVPVLDCPRCKSDTGVFISFCFPFAIVVVCQVFDSGVALPKGAVVHSYQGGSNVSPPPPPKHTPSD